MSRKTYHKPELKSRTIQLGVFGDYGSDKTAVPVSPVRIIKSIYLRME